MTSSHNQRRKLEHTNLPVIITICLFAIIITRNAWVSDDAYITLRTVDNFVNGYGLTWNPTERVQAYTHPLWMFVLTGAYYFTRESFFTTIGLSLVVSLGAVILLTARGAKTSLTATGCILMLSLSRSFTDYATSGLENPLTHLLLIIFCSLYLQQSFLPKTLFWISLVASLGIFNRLDTLLLYAPALLVAFLKVRNKKGLYALIMGQAPLILWLCFATFYYGFPSPNTGYAKLSTGIPMHELVEQGFQYLVDSIKFDPLTLLIILAGVASALLAEDRSKFPFAIGIILYLIYTIGIGGDFMRGRFLSAPFFVAVILIAQYDFNTFSFGKMTVFFATILVAGTSIPFSTLKISQIDVNTTSSSILISDAGIADELLFYFPSNGLFSTRRGAKMPSHVWKEEGLHIRTTNTSVVVRETIGMYGFFAGPEVHIVDQLALSDPLLARLPTVRDRQWRIGHFTRAIPEGYIETLEFGRNVIADKNLAQYYDKLTLITRGLLLDRQRWVAIWKMNTGHYDDLIDFDTYRYPTVVKVDIDEVNTRKVDGTPWNDAGNIIFDDSGIEIALETYSNAPRIEISLDRNDDIQLLYLRDGKTLAKQEIPALYALWLGLATHHLEIPAKAIEAGYNSIRVLPIRGDGDFSLGHIVLWDPATWVACAAQSPCTIPFNTPVISQLLKRGWSTPESWGTWSIDARSTMDIYVEPGYNYDLHIEAFPYELDDGKCDQSIRVWWNDVYLGERPFISCAAQTLSFSVPHTAIETEQNHVQFRYGYFYTSSETGGDERPLGVGFTAIRLTQKP